MTETFKVFEDFIISNREESKLTNILPDTENDFILKIVKLIREKKFKEVAF